MKSSFFSIVKESSWRGLLTNLLLLLVIVGVMVFTFFYAYLPEVTRHGETITVPDLKGMQLEEMGEFLGDRNFRYEVADSGYSDQYPPLAILKQYPLPGAKVKENRKIYLTVKAKKPRSVKIPEGLIDGSLKNAELILRSYGLKLGKIQYKPDLASNAVLELRINGKPVDPGTMVPLGTEIDLIIGDGLGNRVFKMPNFLGLELEEAGFTIAGSGLNMGSIEISVLSPSDLEKILEKIREMDVEMDTAAVVSSGHVYRQHPESGEEVRLGEQVDLWIVSLSREDSIRIMKAWRKMDEEEDESGEDIN